MKGCLKKKQGKIWFFESQCYFFHLLFMFENNTQTKYWDLDGPQLMQHSICLSCANTHAGRSSIKLLISRDSDANTQILLNIYILSSREYF